MATQHPNKEPRYLETFAFADRLKDEVRKSPDFTNLQSEEYTRYQKGEKWARHSLCQATWTLRGSNGVIEVKSSHANDFGCTLITRLTCKSPDFRTGIVESVFGGDSKAPSTLENLAPVIVEWLAAITKPGADPFASVSLPKAP